MVDEAAGRRLPTIRLMEEELYNASTMEQIRRFRSRIQFVPYSFKELKDLDHVEISAMYYLNMLKYVTLLQRHCEPKDMFLWGILNTDAEGDRLLRCKLPEEIPIASPEQPVSTRRPRAEDKQPEEIPIASLEQPVSSKRPRAEDAERGLLSTKKNKVINSRLLPYVQARIQRHSAATETWKKAYEDQLSKLRELQETNNGLRGQVAAKDAEKSTVHALARTEVQRELEELKRSVTELEDFKRSVPAKEKAAEETHALENAHQKEISTLKATCQKYKTSLDGEIGTNADLQARVLNLQDELSTCKCTQEQALQGQKSARAELLEVKKELWMLQVLHQDVDEGNAASAP
ncbi:hypothetical protein R1flu_001515 [Riccia fluitans]|uniref:Uncharacterized protein n=1 Tax=Riccia fluitans TaxID=41844 RepID=A0ABD1Y3N1_9MARC